MFGFFLDHRVSSRLISRGWTPDQLRRFGMMNFSKICTALRKNGYSVDRAVDLWDRVLAGDNDAIEQMRMSAGVYGIMIFGPRRSDDEEDQSPTVEKRSDQVHRICSEWANTASSKLKERTPTSLVALYWGLTYAYVQNGAILAWDFSAEDIERFRLVLSHRFVEWYTIGVGSSSEETVDAATDIFDAACDEGYAIRVIVWSEGSVLDGLREWSRQRQWGRELLDEVDGTTGGVALLTLTGVVHDLVEALRN